jgi:hypothetical protein
MASHKVYILLIHACCSLDVAHFFVCKLCCDSGTQDVNIIISFDII